jgi:hypothetical protein
MVRPTDPRTYNYSVAILVKQYVTNKNISRFNPAASAVFYCLVDCDIRTLGTTGKIIAFDYPEWMIASRLDGGIPDSERYKVPLIIVDKRPLDGI